VAGVLFGDTRHKQDGGKVKNYSPDNVKTWCYSLDGVCGGQLNVGAAHISYALNSGGSRLSSPEDQGGKKGTLEDDISLPHGLSTQRNALSTSPYLKL
jgi:hypothetical protein